jgi:hypothetical protein
MFRPQTCFVRPRFYCVFASHTLGAAAEKLRRKVERLFGCVNRIFGNRQTAYPSQFSNHNIRHCTVIAILQLVHLNGLAGTTTVLYFLQQGVRACSLPIELEARQV